MLFSKPEENGTEDGQMFDMRKIGRRIAELRKSKNITQMALADMMGISFQAVSNWERGESMPDISKLGELSEIFGVSIDDILCNKRAAEIVEEISTGKTPSDITPEELTETVPLMSPKQAEESIGKNKKKMTIPQLAKLALFMDEDDVGEIVKELLKDGASLKDVSAFLPFMDEDDVGAIAKEHLGNGASLKDVSAFLPFMDEDDVGAIAKERLKNGASLDDVSAFLPFMDEDDVATIAKECLKNGVSLDDVSAFLPFMNEWDIGGIIKHLFNKRK